MSSRLRRDELAVASSAATVLIDGRIAVNTRKRYETSLKVLRKWWKDSFNRNLSVPVDRDAIVSFFGWLVDTKYKEKPVAVSTLRGYKSALVFLYKESQAVLHVDTNQRLEALLDGYQRRVAAMRLAGEMSATEGKLHLTFEGYRLVGSCILQRAMWSDAVRLALPGTAVEYHGTGGECGIVDDGACELGS